MPAAIIVGALGASGATAAIGSAIGSAIVGSAVSATTAAMIGSAVVGAGITAAQGGDASDILKGAVLGGITAGVGSTVSSAVTNSLAEAGVDSAISNIAGKAASGAATAAIRGGDIEAGALAGGLSGLTSEVAQAISDSSLDEWSRQQAEEDFNNQISPTEQDVLAAYPDLEMNFPLSTPTDATGPGYYNEETGEYISDELGGLQAPLDNTSGTGALSIPVESVVGQEPKTTEFTTPEPAEREGYDPLTKAQIKQGLDLGVSLLKGTQGGSQPTTRSPLDMSLGTTELTGIPWLDTSHEMLKGRALPQQNTSDPYASMVNEPIKKTNFIQDVNSSQNPFPDHQNLGGLDSMDFMRRSALGFASGGSADESSSCKYGPQFVKCSSPDMLQNVAVARRNSLAHKDLKHLQQRISAMGNMGGMARGGLPKKYQDAAPDGHNPEFVTGLTGFYACGRGTGQSDCIPAMLHDGDYVMDAEAVSALGDGSSKAGKEVLEKFHKQIPHKASSGGKVVPAKIADGEYVFPEGFVTALGGGDNKKGAEILDGLREKLRNHKRSAPTSKIPPKAKSPLDYLKMAKG